jgi:hypothetical protein
MQAYQHKILWFKNSSRYNEDCVVSATIFVLGAALQIWIRTASDWGDIMQFRLTVKQIRTFILLTDSVFMICCVNYYYVLL